MLRALLVAALVLVPVAGFAAQPEKGKPAATQELTFGEGDLVEGALDSPDGDLLDARKDGSFDPMIPVREDFNEKVIRSVSEL